MRITLNLASRPFADLGPAIKQLRIAMAALAVLAIALGLGLRALHQKAEEARTRDHSLDGQIAQIKKEQQDSQAFMRRPENVQLLAQSAALNRLFDEKAFSWTLAMEDLETTLPGGVQVTSLDPVRAKDGHITLHLRVTGPRDRGIELVRNLEHSKRFLMPRITNETAESSTAPGQRQEPVSASNRFDFDLLAEYNPASPEERKAARKAASNSAPKAGAPSVQPAPSRIPAGAAAPAPDQPAHRPGRPPYTGPSTAPNIPPSPGQIPRVPGMNRPMTQPPTQFNRSAGGPQ